MTTSTQHFIELTDITALHFECKNPQCNATLTLSLSKPLNATRLLTCPYCEKPWMQIPIGSIAQKALLDFVSAVSDLQDATRQKQFASRFSVHLQIRTEALPKGTNEKAEV